MNLPHLDLQIHHGTGTTFWERSRVVLALFLISAFSWHVLSYPIFGEHFARLGDKQAIQTLLQWHRWHSVFVVALVGAGTIFYTMKRDSDDRSPLLLIVYSAIVCLSVFAVEVLLTLSFAYIYSKVVHS